MVECMFFFSCHSSAPIPSVFWVELHCLRHSSPSRGSVVNKEGKEEEEEEEEIVLLRP